MEIKRGGYPVLFFILGSVVVVMVSWGICTAHCQRKHFNHTFHIEVIDESDSCKFCHLSENRTFTGLPIVENCMDCHDDSDKQVWGQVENIMQRVTFAKNSR